MYQPKPINPSLLRLNTAAKMVLDAINAGHITAVEGRESQVTDAADALLRAHDQAMSSYPSQASPFLLYRNEILADTAVGFSLRLLVVHLWSGDGLIDLRRLIEQSDPARIVITIELIEAFARNGERDQHFMSLSREIADMPTTEEIAA